MTEPENPTKTFEQGMKDGEAAAKKMAEEMTSLILGNEDNKGYILGIAISFDATLTKIMETL